MNTSPLKVQITLFTPQTQRDMDSPTQAVVDCDTDGFYIEVDTAVALGLGLAWANLWPCPPWP